MISLRLKSIASFINKEDQVVDIGCDHAYLPIYLMKNQLCKTVIAADRNKNALHSANLNIQKENLEKKIPVILSDGLDHINQNEIDTIVMSGMGTSTILHILNKVNKNRIKKMIIQSNNDLYQLRKSIHKFGYYLHDEKVIYEKGHFYVIGMYLKEKHTLTKAELYFGLYNEKNKEYYRYLDEELHKINQRLQYKHLKEKMSILKRIRLLKKYL